MSARIARLRAQRGWSAQDLADRCRDAGYPALTRTILSKIENGHRRLTSVDELTALARVFGMSLDELAHGESSAAVPQTAEPVGMPGATENADPPSAQGEAVCRIGMVEDHSAVVAGMSNILAPHANLRIVATATTVPRLLARTTDLDLVILDLALNDGSTPAENVDRLREYDLPTLVFTSGEDAYKVRAAARAGVLGVICKSESDAEVLDAISRAATGEQVLTNHWAAAVDGDPALAAVQLTPRQLEVLSLYADGMRVSEVAQKAGMSEETVNAHLGRIRLRYAEVGRAAKTKTDLLKRAVEDGWLPIPRRRP